jgi:hypothetical protein
VAPGSLLHTDGLLCYERLEKQGYRHRITLLKGQKESTSERLPREHRVVSLLKRWLLGTHQGAVARCRGPTWTITWTSSCRGSTGGRPIITGSCSTGWSNRQWRSIWSRMRHWSSMCGRESGGGATARYGGDLGSRGYPNQPKV